MNSTGNPHTNTRIRVLYGAILFICIIFFVRLFYVQVIRYSYYEAQAQENQLRKYEIPAERGAIYAFDGDEAVPFVLNEQRFRIVADPQIITDKEETALRVADVLGISKDDVLENLQTEDSRYVILAKKQTKDIKERIEQLYADGDIVGVFAEKTVQRVYPQGPIAASLLGFVDDDGIGRYGVEESLDNELSGQPGRIKALTDQNGVPLLATGENVLVDPVDGEDITLTLDIAMQRQLEDILKQGLDDAKSLSGDAIIIDPYTGEVKAMASYPTYDPAAFFEVDDPQLFTNTAVSSPLEPGSVIKPLTAAAALDSGSVTKSQSYYDPSFYNVDGYTIKNIAEDGGAAQRSVSDILQYSLNTGATWLLMQMGGGELNEAGRVQWHEYMTTHYGFGTSSGIEQGYEEPGYIPPPTDDFGLNITYANTSFGQGMTATPIQLASAISSIVNGGTQYRPTLVAGYTNIEGEFTPSDPVVVRGDVVSPEVSDTIVEFMQTVVVNNSVTRGAARDGYIVGGKTGTAEIANPSGGYFEDKFNGTYVGFVGGDRPEYVTVIRVNEPQIAGYAGSQAAGPIFTSVVDMLIDNFSVASQS